MDRFVLMKKKYKAIFWDNDGVLVDTEELYFRVLAQSLAEYGYQLSREEFIDISLRQGKAVIHHVINRGDLAVDHKTVSDRRWQLYAERLKDGIPLMPGVQKTLEALKPHVRMGVVTSNHREFFESIHRINPSSFWEFVLTSEDFTQFKPEPQPYLMALEKMGLEPHECLVVEDAPRGSLAAKRAGIDCAVIPTELSKDQLFEGETYRLKHVSEILNIIEL